MIGIKADESSLGNLHLRLGEFGCANGGVRVPREPFGCQFHLAAFRGLQLIEVVTDPGTVALEASHPLGLAAGARISERLDLERLFVGLRGGIH